MVPIKVILANLGLKVVEKDLTDCLNIFGSLEFVGGV